MALVLAELLNVLDEIVGARRTTLPHPLVQHPRHAPLPGAAQRRQTTVERPRALLIPRLGGGGRGRSGTRGGGGGGGHGGLRHRFGSRREEAAEEVQAGAGGGDRRRHGFRVCGVLSNTLVGGTGTQEGPMHEIRGVAYRYEMQYHSLQLYDSRISTELFISRY